MRDGARHHHLAIPGKGKQLLEFGAARSTAYGNIHEIAFRPWQSDNIPRRYLHAAACSSTTARSTRVNYSIIEDGGFAGFGQGVEWCVVGLDRNWAYNPACKAAGPYPIFRIGGRQKAPVRGAFILFLKCSICLLGSAARWRKGFQRRA